jgi:hypothetical protein
MSKEKVQIWFTWCKADHMSKEKVQIWFTRCKADHMSKEKVQILRFKGTRYFKILSRAVDY